MRIKHLHSWKVNIEEARAIQLELKDRIILQNLSGPVRLIAGADVSFSSEGELGFAAVTVFKYPEMEMVEQTDSSGYLNFPYIPGYLTFREAPILLQAFEKVVNIPDLILFDGQGIAHPRKMGLAAHLGLALDLPAVGCAKSVLVGEFKEPSVVKGSWSLLTYEKLPIGAVVRTREAVKPVFVSPGFKITFNEAIFWVLKTCITYRIPEPIRRSHLAVNQLRSNYEKQIRNK